MSTGTGASHPRFSTILVARTSGERPTELEIQLRKHCQKIRVVSNLSSAHVILPQEQGLALRVYYPDMQQRWELLNTTTASTSLSNAAVTDAAAGEMDDIDGIRRFCHSFQWSFVIFVVPDISVLAHSRSMVQQTMRLVDALPLDSTNLRQHQPMRILVVHDTSQVILGIVELANGISPKRCAMRRAFCKQVQRDNFCADETDNDPTAAVASHDEKRITATTTQRNNAALAIHVRQVVIDWANRRGLPRGEAELLMNALQTLSSLAGAAKAPNRPLDNIPVEDRTKQELLRFFSGSDNDDDDTDDEENMESVHFQPDEPIPRAHPVASPEFVLPMSNTLMEPLTHTLFPVGYTLMSENYGDFDVRQESIMSPVFVDPPTVQHQQQQVMQQIHSMHHQQPLPHSYHQAAPTYHPVSHHSTMHQPSMSAMPSCRQDSSVAMSSNPTRQGYSNVQMTPCYVVNQRRVPEFQRGAAPSSYYAGTPEFSSQERTATGYQASQQQQQGMISSTRMASVGHPTTTWQQGPFVPSTVRMSEVGYRTTPSQQHRMLPSTARMAAAGYQTIPPQRHMPSMSQIVGAAFQPTLQQQRASTHSRAVSSTHGHTLLNEPRR